MLARADSSPPRQFSNSPGPSTIPLAVPVPSRKRKQSAISGHAASSPAPDQVEISTERTESLTLPARNDLSARPRLSISRFPVFPSDSPDEYHATEQLAMNRIGFKYTAAGISPEGSVLPCTTIESLPNSYRVSWEDRSPFVKVTADGLGLAGDKGFRSARGNAPVREGKWYMEIRVEQGGGTRPFVETNARREGSHVRLGWARREAPLNGPVGLDGYSYGVRDKTGEKVTLSRCRAYGRPFGAGDVIGMYICLPERRKPSSDSYDPAHIKRERIPIDFKGQEYFESLEYPQCKEMMSLMDYSGKAANATSVPSAVALGKKSTTTKNLPNRGRGVKPLTEPVPTRLIPTLPDSCVAFFVNGECQGTAFQDLYDYLPLRNPDASRKGKSTRRTREGAREHKENPFDDGSLGYYPFISLFNDARVRINPGPNFDFPPPPDVDALLRGEGVEDWKDVTWRPLCERYPEFMEEQWALDVDEEKEAKAELEERDTVDAEEARRQVQREKRRQQAAARRSAKKPQTAATSKAGSARDTPQRGSSMGSPRASAVPDERPGSSLALPETRQYGGSHVGYEHKPSPAPTITSDQQGLWSGYNTDSRPDTPAGHTPDFNIQPTRQLQPWTEFDMRAM
ncbi:hypothetical protein FIBSPDRAFT_741799 [Athelia psychrophila]|uniref:B30.2/SPRY domain-containing protein n=1 Tax=Athelia psychrophila TaxID=1759441 RepID=A0A166JED8_9AGAM|nr:hypothetical protein FIBSPDRAFT_741799 [Fibularhizoctonia sp. CBS 109695]